MVTVNVSMYLTKDQYDKYYERRKELNKVAREAILAKLVTTSEN